MDLHDAAYWLALGVCLAVVARPIVKFLQRQRRRRLRMVALEKKLRDYEKTRSDVRSRLL